MKKLGLERLMSLQPKIRNAYYEAIKERGLGDKYSLFLVNNIKNRFDEIDENYKQISNRQGLTRIYGENFEDYESKLN